MSKNLITFLLALLLLMGNNPKITENGTTVSEVESRVTTADTESEESVNDRFVIVGPYVEDDNDVTKIVEAEKSVNASELWELSTGYTVTMGKGDFTIRKAKEVNKMTILGKYTPNLLLEASKEYDIKFIPTLNADNVVLELRLYDKSGTPIKGVNSEESFKDYIENQKQLRRLELENASKVAEEVKGSVNLSTLKEDVYYAVSERAGVGFINDLGKPVLITESSLDFNSKDWEVDKEILLSYSFPNELHTYSTGLTFRGTEESYFNYIKISSSYIDYDVASIIESEDCIKISEPGNFAYDTYSKDYIYNDTNSDVDVIYNDGESVKIPAGALWDFDWVYYKDLRIEE